MCNFSSRVGYDEVLFMGVGVYVKLMVGAIDGTRRYSRGQTVAK